MQKKQSARRARADIKQKERRLPTHAGPLRRVLRWMAGLLRRPLGFMRNGRGVRLGFVERRRAPPDALEAADLRTDLRSRMLSYPPDHAARMLSHLVQVHDEFGRAGWAAVTALPPTVLDKALFQAQMLLRDGSSPPLKKLIERLRALQPARDKAAAEETPQAAPPPPRQTGAALEISEASQEDFEATERSWFGTLPPPTPEAPAAPEARP
jgi:hypothetical protein